MFLLVTQRLLCDLDFIYVPTEMKLKASRTNWKHWCRDEFSEREPKAAHCLPNTTTTTTAAAAAAAAAAGMWSTTAAAAGCCFYSGSHSSCPLLLLYHYNCWRQGKFHARANLLTSLTADKCWCVTSKPTLAGDKHKVTSKPTQPWMWCRRQGRSWSRAVSRDVGGWKALTARGALNNTCQWAAYQHQCQCQCQCISLHTSSAYHCIPQLVVKQGLTPHILQSRLGTWPTFWMLPVSVNLPKSAKP